MNNSELKDLVIDALEDIKAEDIICLDVVRQTDIADFMIVATGTSNRQVKSLANNVIEQAKAAGYKPIGVEGQDAGEWILVDLTDVIVHVMLPAVREFYDLEKLWTMTPEESTSSGESIEN